MCAASRNFSAKKLRWLDRHDSDRTNVEFLTIFSLALFKNNPTAVGLVGSENTSGGTVTHLNGLQRGEKSKTKHPTTYFASKIPRSQVHILSCASISNSIVTVATTKISNWHGHARLVVWAPTPNYRTHSRSTGSLLMFGIIHPETRTAGRRRLRVSARSNFAPTSALPRRTEIETF